MASQTSRAACVAVCACVLAAACSAGPPYPASDPNNKGNWTLFEAMSDEFDGAALNTTQWGPGTWLGRQPGLFAAHNVRVGGGAMELWARHETINSTAERKQGYGNYTTAYIASRLQTTYGYFEARLRAGDSLVSSSFWFMTQGQEGAFPWHIEIDVCELTGRSGAQWNHNFPSHTHLWKSPLGPNNSSAVRDKCHCTADHQPGAPCTAGNVYQAPFVWSDDFHVVGMDWSATNFTVFVDGKPVYSRPNYCLHAPVAMIFDRETMYFGLPPFSALPDHPFTIDYVRVWKQPGQPH